MEAGTRTVNKACLLLPRVTGRTQYPPNQPVTLCFCISVLCYLMFRNSCSDSFAYKQSSISPSLPDRLDLPGFKFQVNCFPSHKVTFNISWRRKQYTLERKSIKLKLIFCEASFIYFLRQGLDKLSRLALNLQFFFLSLPSSQNYRHAQGRSFLINSH